eukprot:2023623-Prymnesium_polylepis.3
MDVKKDGNIVPYHRLCAGHDMLRRMFECTAPAPHKPGTNMQLYATEWTLDHPGEAKPWNVINWQMGTNVGVWSGWCTCPGASLLDARASHEPRLTLSWELLVPIDPSTAWMTL